MGRFAVAVDKFIGNVQKVAVGLNCRNFSVRRQTLGQGGNVFFRDVEYIWDVVLMLIMYTCAIFYKTDAFVGTDKYWMFRLNPLYALIKCFRDCIYGVPMEFSWLLYAAVFSIVCCLIGLLIFKKKQDKFVFYL